MSQISPSFWYEVQGSQLLIDQYAQLEEDIERKFSRKALREGSVPIREAIEASTAYTDRSGLLRDSDVVGPGRGDRPGITSMLIRWISTIGNYASALTKSEVKEKARIQAALIGKYGGNINAKYRTWYAGPVEFGHEASGWYAKMAGAKRVPEHSFERSSFDATVDTAADIVEQSLADQITSA